MGQAPQTCPRCVRACRLVLPRPGAGDHCQCDHRMSPMSLRGRRRDLRLDIDARVSLAFDEAGRCKRGGQCGKSRASGWCQIAGVLDSRCSWCGRFRCQRCPPVHSGVNVRENATTSARHGQPLRDCACHMGSVDDAQQEMRAGADFASVLPTREPRVPLSNAVSLHARPDAGSDGGGTQLVRKTGRKVTNPQIHLHATDSVFAPRSPSFAAYLLQDRRVLLGSLPRQSPQCSHVAIPRDGALPASMRSLPSHAACCTCYPLTLNSKPYTLRPTPQTLHPKPYILPIPYILNPRMLPAVPYTLNPTPRNPNPKPLHAACCALHPTPQTLLCPTFCVRDASPAMI